MTIYLVKYLDIETQQKCQFATSSFINANKKKRELEATGKVIVFNVQGSNDQVEKLTPKSQADVITLINSL